MTWGLPCRTKHISGSPRHKGLKKTHFIKNMRQYDTRNSRYHVPREQVCGRREAELECDPGPVCAALALPCMSTLEPRVSEQLLPPRSPPVSRVKSHQVHELE